MSILKANERGNYEYTENEYAELREHVEYIDYVLQIMHAYCEHFLFDAKQIAPILFMVEFMEKELRGIYCRF